jgi:cell division protein FtsL
MIRILNLLAVLALVGAAIYAYSIKYATVFNAEEIVKLKHEIQAKEDRIGMLRAEWAYLVRPERIQALADKLLDLAPIGLSQIVKADDLPAKAPKVDTIGRKLEELGFAEPTQTPKDSRVPAAATPVSPAR